MLGALGLGKEARVTAKNMLDSVIAASHRAGIYNWPLNFGDILLGAEVAESAEVEREAVLYRKGLAAKRKDGVRDEDIREYWNLSTVERLMMDESDNFIRGGHYVNRVLELFGSTSRAGTPEVFEVFRAAKESAIGGEAVKSVWRHFPQYTFGDPSIRPEKPTWLTPADFPLPVELKNRINKWIAKEGAHVSERMEKYSTMNALIREEIRKGNL